MDDSILLRQGLNLWIRMLSDTLKLADVLEWIILKFFGFISCPVCVLKNNYCYNFSFGEHLLDSRVRKRCNIKMTCLTQLL